MTTTMVKAEIGDETNAGIEAVQAQRDCNKQTATALLLDYAVSNWDYGQ